MVPQKMNQPILGSRAVGYLDAYHIPYPEHGVADSADKAAELSKRIGFPVVSRIVSLEIPHKSDVGGVVVNLKNENQFITGYEILVKNIKRSIPYATIEGVLVCKHADPGLEVIVGTHEDSVFGPTLIFGMGGIFTEILKDVNFRIAPIEKIDEEEMIKEIRRYPLLQGTRGQNRVSIDTFIDLLLKVSQMVTECKEIVKLDLNPVRLYEDSPLVLDVRILKKTIRTHPSK
jgi:acyl-CoA synthetase (NDP forming)